MPYIVWDTNKELGHPRIDGEHRAMLVQLNALVDVVFGVGRERPDPCRGRNRQACVEETVAALRAVAAAHFASEEALMAESDYPVRQVHADIHAELLEQLDRFAEHFHSTNADSLPHAVRFLREWFEFHIDTYDRGLVRWLHGQRELSGDADD